MKRYTEEELKGKFVVAYDTICDGNQCMMTGEEDSPDYAPLLFNSEDEAIKEIFDGNLATLQAHERDEQLEEYNEGVTPELIAEMAEIFKTGDAARMCKFMEDHPECNDSGEWAEPADKFVMNRKVFFGEEGGYVSGKKLNEI